MTGADDRPTINHCSLTSTTHTQVDRQTYTQTDRQTTIGKQLRNLSSPQTTCVRKSNEPSNETRSIIMSRISGGSGPGSGTTATKCQPDTIFLCLRHCRPDMFSGRPSARSFVCYQTCEHGILKKKNKRSKQFDKNRLTGGPIPRLGVTPGGRKLYH